MPVNKPDLLPSHRREIDLDIVRGVAILLAIGWHINHIPTGYPIVDALLAPGATIGWAGVDLFFVLSGFLIGSAIIREIQRTGGFDYKKFFIRRVFRLWPVLYVFLFSMLAIVPFSDFFWQSALHVQNYIRPKSAHHLWSLAVEEHFYLIMGVMIPIVVVNWNWRKSLPVILISTIFLSFFLRLLGVLFWWGDSDFSAQTHYRLDALSAGVLLSFVATEKVDLFNKIIKYRALYLVIVVFGVCFLWVTPRDSDLGLTVGYSVAWISSLSFILMLYKSGVEKNIYYIAILLAFIGQVSYPLYLWHVPVLKAVEMLGDRLAVSGGVLIFLAYSAAIALSAGMTILVERPVMRWRDKRFPPKVPAVEMNKSESVKSL